MFVYVYMRDYVSATNIGVTEVITHDSGIFFSLGVWQHACSKISKLSQIAQLYVWQLPCAKAGIHTHTHICPGHACGRMRHAAYATGSYLKSLRVSELSNCIFIVPPSSFHTCCFPLFYQHAATKGQSSLYKF